MSMIEGELKKLAASIFLTLKKKEAGAFLDIYTLVSPVWWHAASGTESHLELGSRGCNTNNPFVLSTFIFRPKSNRNECLHG
jgi:hypothetical protein